MEPHPHTRSSCSACGTSPVNHRLAYFFDVVNEIIRKTVGALFISQRFPVESRLAHILHAGITGFCSRIGLVRFAVDREKAASGRSKLIWDEAARRGIRMEQIVFCGKHLEQYRARINDRWFYFESIPIPPWLPQKGYTWVDDKLILSHKLEAAGLPVPKTRLVTSWSSARRAFAELSKPVIMKPRTGSRSRHTTTHINTIKELRSAYALAKEIARELVIEEHLFGSVCRATVVNGKLAGFFCANPPQIRGDGVHTVRQLIFEENRVRHERMGAIEVNDDLISFVSRKGYTLAHILPHGTMLDLSAKTGRFYGGYTKEMLPDVHQKMHLIFGKAASLVEAPVIGFDLISANPVNDPEREHWGIIECNSLPFIDLHYFALEGKPIDIAKDIWDLWMAPSRAGMTEGQSPRPL